MNLLTNDTAPLAWTQLWQVTAVALVIGFAVRIFCRHRPHLAYMLWMLVIIKCLTPPLWSSPTGLFSWAQLRIETPVAATEAQLPGPELFDNRASGSEVAPVAPPSPHRTPEKTFSIALLLGLLWLCGAIVLASVVLLRWVSVRRLVLRAAPADAPLRSLVDRLTRRFALRGCVTVRITDKPLSPAVFGLARPVIILPNVLVWDFKGEDLEPIVAHELAHIRRHDTLVATLQIISQVVWWFHPLVWWANRRIARERERCCDEEVIANLGCSPPRYAQSLLNIMQTKRRLHPVLALPAVGSLRVTEDRLEHIMKRANLFHHHTPRWCWAVLAAGILLLVPGSGLALHDSSEIADLKSASNRKINQPRPTAVEGNSEQVELKGDDETQAKAIAAIEAAGALLGRNDKGEVIRATLFNTPRVNGDVVYLKALSKLEHVDLNSTKISDAAFEHLRDLTNLRALFFWDTEITDAGLKHLKDITSLRTLGFSSPHITDAGLEHLAGLTNLQQLWFDCPKVTDAGLERHLSGLKLRSLRISGMTDARLENFQVPGNPEGVTITGTELSDAALVHLHRLRNLIQLRLGPKITDAGLEHLKELVSIQILWLNGTQVTDRGLANLSGLTGLVYLNLADTNVTGAGLVHLSGLTNLKALHLERSKVADAGLEHLAGLHNLTILRLQDTRITDVGVKHLEGLKMLRILNLHRTKISQKAVNDLRKALPDCGIEFP